MVCPFACHCYSNRVLLGLKDNCDKEPYSDLKDACEWILCRKLATETDLKTCTRCYMVAYCSKECQARDWSVHKDYCKQVDGELVKTKIDAWRRWKAENHFYQPSHITELNQFQ